MHIRKLAGQTAIYGLSSIVGRLLNYFLVPLYTRVFLPAEYGVVTEFYAYVSFLIIVFTYGMETTFFRFNESELDKEKVFSTALISLLFSSALLALNCFFGSSALASMLRYPGHAEYVVWFGLILACDAVTSIPFARLRAQGKPGRFAFLKFINILLNVALNLFFLLACPFFFKQEQGWLHDFVLQFYNPSFGIGYIFISNLLASVLTLLLLLPSFKGIGAGFDKVLWRRMMLYSLPLLVAGLAGMINETMDRILLKYLLPPDTALEQVGIYGACYKLSILMTLFIQMFRYAAEPFFFKQAKEDNARQVYADVMTYFVLACSFIFLGIMLYIDVVKFFIGPNYYPGLKVVPILLLANLCLGVFFNLSIWYKLSGKTSYGAWFAVFGAALTLLLNAWWIPLFGYMGSAWATLVCYASMMLVSFYVGQKNYPVPYQMRRILLYLGVALGLYFIAVFMRSLMGNSLLPLLAFNTCLMGLFVGLVIWKEKAKIL